MSRRPGYIIGDHWLEVAFDRICAGDQEQAVMSDYGWVRLTDAEREAVVRAWHGLLKLVAFEKQLADVHLADARTINALLARTKNG